MPSKYYDQLQGGHVRVSDAERYLVEQRSVAPDIGFSELLGTAADDSLIWNAAGRWSERRASNYKADESWVLDKQTKEDLLRDYREEDYDYLTGAASQEEFLARKSWIAEDIARERKLAQAGGAGIATNIAVSLFDPAALTLGIATGGMSYVRQGSKAARIMKHAGLVGAESAALEGMLAKGNTQSETSDLIFAFGTGAILGGALGAFSKARPNAAAADEALVADVDSYSVKEASESGIAQRNPEEYEVGVEEVLDLDRMDYNLMQYRAKLESDASAVASRQELKNIKKEQEALQSRIDELNSTQAKNRTEVQGLRENKSTIESEEAARLGTVRSEIEAKHADKIKAQQAKVDELAAKVESSTNPKKANARLYTQQNKLDDMIKARDAEIEKAASQSRARVSDAEHRLNKELGDRNASAAMRKQEIESRIADLQARIDAVKRGKAARKQLSEFNKLDRKGQMQRAHDPSQEGSFDVPMKEVEVRRQKEAAKPTVRDDTPEGDTAKPDGQEGPTLGTVTSPDTPSDSVGAARAGAPMRGRAEAQHEITPKESELLDYIINEGVNTPENAIAVLPFGRTVSKYLQGVYSTLSNSESFAVRGLNRMLFEAPQGGTARNLTASVLSSINQREIRAAMRNRLQEGYEDYARESGKVYRAPTKAGKYMAREMDRELRQEFYKKVMIELQAPGTYSSNAIKHAAEGARDQFRVAGKKNKDNDVLGFEDIDLEQPYVTSVVSDANILQALKVHKRAKVRAVLARAYQTGGRPVGARKDGTFDDEAAGLIADAYIARALNNEVSVAESFRNTTGKDVEKLEEALRKSGVEEDVIQAFLRSTAKDEATQHMSDRARMSLRPNLAAEVNGLSAIDLFDSNLPKLLEAYTIEAAGGAALARLGFRSRQEFEDTLQAVHKHAINADLKNPHQIAEEIQFIRDGVDMIYGRSVNPHAGTRWSRNLSRLRDLTALLRLQAVGLAAIPESARGITNRGLKAWLREVPASASLIRGSSTQREGGKFSGQLKDPELRELDEVIGYAGEDHIIFQDHLIRAENIEEAGAEHWVDQWLAQGKRIQGITSFFRAFQGGGEKIAARSLHRNMKEWMYGTGDLRLSDVHKAESGLTDDFLKEMQDWVKANPKSEEFNGRNINIIDWAKMPEPMRERYQVGLTRLVQRDMLRPMVGETPIFMHKVLGQTITQFRSFSIASLDKQLIHDVRHDRAAGALILMWSVGLGAIAHSVAGTLNMDENAFEPHNMLFGIWNRMGQTASMGLALDGLATLGVLPDELMAAPNRYGFRSYGANSVPVIGMAEDVRGVFSKTADFLLDSDSNYDGADVLNQVQKVTPFAKVVGINQAFNAIEEEIR